MSEIYKRYLHLKIKNSQKFYLFKCGIFFIFIDEDARIMSNVLNLKLVKLNTVILKCGFPINSLNKYMSILNNLNYDVEIVDNQYDTTLSYNSYTNISKLKSLMTEIAYTKIDSLSISQAYDFLYKIQDNIIEYLQNDNCN